jgi:hypothetical protein
MKLILITRIGSRISLGGIMRGWLRLRGSMILVSRCMLYRRWVLSGGTMICRLVGCVELSNVSDGEVVEWLVVLA